MNQPTAAELAAAGMHITHLERKPTRRERKIERMRVQSLGHASRSTYRTSGRPDMARPGVWRALADRPEVTPRDG